MNGSQNSLKNEIIKIVIDKLLIGMLILALALFANSLLGKYKSQQSFRTQLNKTRVDKIGDVWEALYVYESTVDDFINEFDSLMSEPDRNVAMKRVTAINDKSLKLRENLLNLSRKNRFWIGENTFKEIENYLDVLGELLVATATFDAEKVKAVDQQRQKIRKNVLQIRDDLLKE